MAQLLQHGCVLWLWCYSGCCCWLRVVVWVRAAPWIPSQGHTLTSVGPLGGHPLVGRGAWCKVSWWSSRWCGLDVGGAGLLLWMCCGWACAGCLVEEVDLVFVLGLCRLLPGGWHRAWNPCRETSRANLLRSVVILLGSGVVLYHGSKESFSLLLLVGCCALLPPLAWRPSARWHWVGYLYDDVVVSLRDDDLLWW